MADALSRGDGQAYFQALTTGTLFLPDLAEPGPQQLVTVRSGADTYLIAFTSCEALASRLSGVAAFRTTTFAELAGKWPDPDWMLAVNPDTPIQAYAPIEVIRAGADGRLVLEAERGNPDLPANDLEAELDQAVRGSDVDGIIGALVTATVHVPVTGDGRPRPLAERTIAAFTSRRQLAAAVPAGLPAAVLPFLDVVLDWPGDDWQLVLNPAGRAPLEFAGPQVRGFVEWARQARWDPATGPEHRPLVATDMVWKVVPSGQLDAYLRDHRGDVSGAVRRCGAGDLVEEAFAAAPPGDLSVHILQWTVHCPDLYQPEPGVAGAWRVQAVALPHGARIRRLRRDGRPAYSAAFDADVMRWTPVHGAEQLHQALTT